MTEISKEDVRKDNYKLFMEELERLKTGPNKDDKELYDEKANIRKVGIFRKKTVVDIRRGEMLKKGGYITLNGLCSIIEKYLEEMSKVHQSIINIFYTSGYNPNNTKISFDYDKLSIMTGYFNDEIEKGIKIDCKSLPKLISNESKIDYNFMKSNIYKYISYIIKYKKIDSKKYNIGEITTLRFEEDDVLNKNSVTLVIQFGEFAMIEVQITSQDYSIITFSSEDKINTYLSDNSKEIFKSIFIEEEKLKDFFDIFGNI